MGTLGGGIAPAGLPETGRTYEKGLYSILRGGKREYTKDIKSFMPTSIGTY